MIPAMYFHGSTAVFAPGDFIVPGVESGMSFHGRSAHVYGTTTLFDIIEADLSPEQDTVDNHISMAIDTALLWASRAADLGGCNKVEHEYEEDDECEFHYEVFLEGGWLPCIHVYEIEPLGNIERDGSSDVDAPGVRMSKAQVIRELTYADKPMFSY